MQARSHGKKRNPYFLYRGTIGKVLPRAGEEGGGGRILCKGVLNSGVIEDVNYMKKACGLKSIEREAGILVFTSRSARTAGTNCFTFSASVCLFLNGFKMKK